MKKKCKSFCILLALTLLICITPINANANEVINTYMSGGTYTFTAPAGGLYKFDLYGGRGATATNGSYAGGNGGYARKYLVLEKGDTVTCVVGSAGSGSSGSSWSDYYFSDHPTHEGGKWWGTEWDYTGYSGGQSYISYKGATQAYANGGTGSRSARDDGGVAGYCCHPATANWAGSAGGYSSSGTVTFQGTNYTNTGSNGGNTTQASGWMSVELVAYSFLVTMTPNTEDWTNEDVVVTLDAIGETAIGFSTDGTNYSSETEYVITDNGTYDFYAQSDTGTISHGTIDISNIDKNAPVFEGITYYKKPSQTATVTINVTDT